MFAAPLPARAESKQGWTSVLVQTQRCLQTAVGSKQFINVPFLCASMHHVLCMSKEMLEIGGGKGLGNFTQAGFQLLKPLDW